MLWIGHTPYVIIGVAVGVAIGVIAIVVCMISFTILIWRRLKTPKALERASIEADQSDGDLDHNNNNENGHDNGQSNGQSSNDSDQNSDDEHAQLLGKSQLCYSMVICIIFIIYR